MKKRVALFVDGFNIYHALNKHHYKKYKWLNIYSLGESLLSQNVLELKSVYLFTALTHWNHKKVVKHRTYLNALEHYSVKVVKGTFRKKDKYCPLCKQKSISYEEKETDVNIALHLLKLAYDNEYDVAMVLSGDSDLVPAIKEVKKRFKKEVFLVIPPQAKAENLKLNSDRHIKLKKRHLESNQLPEEIVLKSKDIILKPTDW